PTARMRSWCWYVRASFGSKRMLVFVAVLLSAFIAHPPLLLPRAHHQRTESLDRLLALVAQRAGIHPADHGEIELHSEARFSLAPEPPRLGLGEVEIACHLHVVAHRAKAGLHRYLRRKTPGMRTQAVCALSRQGP